MRKRFSVSAATRLATRSAVPNSTSRLRGKLDWQRQRISGLAWASAGVAKGSEIAAGAAIAAVPRTRRRFMTFASKNEELVRRA